MIKQVFTMDPSRIDSFKMVPGDHVIYFDDSLNVTESSISYLRNLIIEKYEHRIRIACVPTSRATIGIFIHDWDDDNRWVFVGDGFRRDGLGEGGNGFRYVLDFLHVMGLLEYISFFDNVMLNYKYEPNDDAETREMRFDLIREEMGFEPPEINIQDSLDKFVMDELECLYSETHAVASSYVPEAWA